MSHVQDTASRKKNGRPDTNSYQQSQVFYDTVFKKFSRNKITQLLYGLAFVEPKQSDLPDTLQVLNSDIPFEQYRGKIIRKIEVIVLPPFGASIYDTGRKAATGIGKALNGVHMNSRKYIITRNLLFKPGEPVNPSLLADNERILRNMRAIDNARIVVEPGDANSDSVDLTVIVKDVWSIGIDAPLITPRQVRFRIYDANFLGQGDQLTTNLSLDLYRAPFFMFEGLAYTYSNIAGSLIDATIGFTADNLGNNILLFHIERSFLTNQTKWAGGGQLSVFGSVNGLPDSVKITSYGNNQGLWLGRAFLLKGQKKISRFIITAGAYRRDYTSRPVVTIDTNMAYYNNLQILTTLSFSRNNYYITDYVLDFGKTENLPYGHLFQATVGMDQSDFYTRIYSGINLSVGNFYNNFGYVSASIKLGGFFNHASFEDAVVKFNLHYFTPLLKTTNKRYKFRTFMAIDFRHAFNSRSNNLDYYDANQNFKINKVDDAVYFQGAEVLTGSLSSVCFTPWYFYGFRFAMMVDLQTGFVAQKKEPLFNASLFSSIGLSIIIKNDNLIFPAFVISGYFYPSAAGNVRQFQFTMNSNLGVQYDDFNVTAPHEENLGN